MGAENTKGIGKEFFKRVLDQLHTYVYITDVDTDEIVYMNQAMKRAFHLDHPEGCVCWQVLQKGMTGRCPFCKVGELKEGAVCAWDEENTLDGHIYSDCDSLIRWEGHGYHVQDSVDVSRYVELSENASIDELTGLLNRRAGRERLVEAMLEAQKDRKPLTVVLYDINELKQVNDRYGHKEGDHLIRYVAEQSSQELRHKDFLFRLSGDEFIIVFYDDGAKSVKGRMQRILRHLAKEKENNSIFYEASFSYGIFEVYPEDHYTVSDIIARADEQMYYQKRDFHIMQAKKKLLLQEDLKEMADAMPLEYDRNQFYKALTASTEDYIFIGNLKTGTFRYPPAMVEEFGLPGEMVPNAAAFWGRLIHPHDEAGFLESNQEIADGRVRYHSIEYRARNVKGEWVWLRCRGHMFYDREGRPELFAGMIANLGKRNQIDHMTGLYNRFEFEGMIKKHLVAEGGPGQIGVMILDMDGFKNINDLYDRSFGDEVLRLTGKRIASLLPPNASLYRLDGDEFGIIILGGDEADHIRIFGSIQHKFHKQQEYNGRKYYCTVSAGYAVYPKDGDNYLDLLKCANYSLEHSKLMGRNRITPFSPDILRKKERRLELAELLRESVDRGFAGFYICYQPQVDSRTKRLYGAEALARWRCEKYGDVSPGEFIPILEKNGLIIQLGSWVFYHAVKQCRQWCNMNPDFRMSVNLSYLQLLEGDIVSEVRQTLSEFRLSPSNITLELTETYLVHESAGNYEIMNRLHEIGIKLAMDDFGMGYSSLFSLKNIPVDIVKIDRGFVKGITSDLFNATFIRSITELCHNVDKVVCLEGVETEEEYDVVKDTGLELIQGFYFGFPITAQMFEKKWM